MSVDFKDVEVDLEFDKVRQIVTRECRSVSGIDYLLSIVPFADVSEAQKELEILSQIRTLFETVSSFPCFGTIDYEVLSGLEISGSIISSESLLKIRGTLQNIRQLQNMLIEGNFEEAPLVSVEIENLYYNESYLEKLEKTLDMDGSILESASPELAAARKEQRNLKSSIENNLNGYIKDDKYKGCFDSAYVTTLNDRFVIPVLSSSQGKIGGVVQGSSHSGNSVFIEPMKIVGMNNSLMSARAREKAEINRIMGSLTAIASSNYHQYVVLSEKLAWLDSLYARAQYANSTSSSKPVFSNTLDLKLTNVRHPLIGEDCVPLSLHLEGEQNVVILSGANSGGKTVTLKTVGLAALMASSGFHILAEEDSSIPFFPAIFVEIGDRQSLSEHLSSFSSHITDIALIIKRAETVPSGSLILFDEIMSGTDPQEGAALAEAVLTNLSEKGCLVLATTHFGTLKLLSERNPHFRNCAVEFDRKTFRPTYRLLSDVPGASYGFEIARRYGLPPKIVDLAGELLGDGRHRISDIVLKLEDKLTEATRMAELHTAEAYKVEKLREKLSVEKQRFNEEKEERLEALMEKERKNLLDFRKSMEDELSFLKEQDNSRQGLTRTQLLRKVDKKLISLKGRHRQSGIELSPKVNTEISVGSKVKIEFSGMRGVVLSINNKKKNARVDCAGRELTISIDELSVVDSGSSKSSENGTRGKSDLLKSAAEATKNRASMCTVEVKSELPYELDLRGLRVHEAIENLERHLDIAIAKHEKSIRVIHGKGTGALKRAVQEFLHSHPVIKSYRRGEQGEGDFGVTIATL